MGSAGIRSGRDFARGWRTHDLGRLGRRCGRPGKTRRLSPRSAQNDGRLRLPRIALRSLRPRLRPHPHQFRPAIKRRHRQIPQVYGRGADLVVTYGGSISGEHGDGQARGELLPKMFGAELVQAFREFKSAWDPEWKMNPGKLIEPYKLDENLRLGSAYSPWEPRTVFQFTADHGSLAEATLRCVGVGKCRREEGGLMCPSYRVTREEEHSTRGRAHLLWEMTQGEVIRDGWRSQEVKRSLDLCLACKGCKTDCPVGVDVATYKSEFLSHYYEGRLRPR